MLYKPLFDGDQTKINEIISVMGYLYRWIGFIILGAGCILACFLPIIFPPADTGFSINLVVFIYLSFLASSLLGYFINYRQNLLAADQKNYIVAGYYQTANIIKIILQMWSACETGSFYLWGLIELVFGIVYSFILNWKINKTYPWLKTEMSLGKRLLKKYPDITKYVKQLFVHRISFFAQSQTAPVLIYSFVNLNIVALYANYTLVTQKISGLLTNLTNSSGAGVGNLIAEGNSKKVLNIFWSLEAAQFLLAFYAIFMLFELINPFIVLWIGKSYLLDDIFLTLLLINAFIQLTRPVVDQFVFGYGLFYDVWAPVTEAVIYVVGAVIGGYFWGLNGIMCAVVLSAFIIVWWWKPFFLFTKGIKISYWQYLRVVLTYYCIGFSVMWISHMLAKMTAMTPYGSFTDWMLYACVVSLIFLIIYLPLAFVAGKGMKDFSNRFIRIRK